MVIRIFAFDFELFIGALSEIKKRSQLFQAVSSSTIVNKLPSIRLYVKLVPNMRSRASLFHSGGAFEWQFLWRPLEVVDLWATCMWVMVNPFGTDMFHL